MSKIEIGDSLLKALKVEAALLDISMQELAEEILEKGLNQNIKNLSAQYDKRIKEAKGKIQEKDVKREEDTFCTKEQTTEEPEPIASDDMGVTLQLLHKLKELLLVKDKVTNRELVADFPEISKSGLFLHKYNILQNKRRFYTTDCLPQIDQAIEELDPPQKEDILL